jgi:hypothetical protein
MEKYQEVRIAPNTIEDLERLLADCGVPIEEWGQGAAKTTHHLLEEVRAGETELSVTSEGELERRVSVLWLDVLSADGSWHLLEEKQVFKDGRERRRKLSSSLGEKMTPGEGVEEATYRALAEELGVTGVEQLDYLGNEQTTHTPDSYPGLSSHYDTHTVRVHLSPESYDPAGYREVQKDKTTYFVWEPVTE